MNTKGLKAKILDLLIKGELTKAWRESHKDTQNASELLEQIRVAKEKRLNEELKAKGKKPNAIVEINPVSKNDEPFEIPSTWTWCRLGDVGFYTKGPFGSSLTKSMFVPANETSIKVYEQKNAIKKDFTLGHYYISEEKFSTMKSFIVEPHDIIVSCAGTIGEVYELPDEAPIGIINQALMRVDLIYKEMNNFWKIYFDYFLKKEASKEAFGTAIKNIPPFQILKNYLLPLPPLEEQVEIARIAQSLLQMADNIESSYTNLKGLSKNAKAKVLDLLIKGELTTKWRSEHPTTQNASELLEQIRVAKEKRLNEELKAKGKKPNAIVEINPVSKNDEPFEIPSTWTWCRLGDLAEIITDGTHKTPEYVDKGVPFLSIQNISKGHFDFSKIKYISQQEHEQLCKRVKPTKGDILFCRIGTLGRAIEVNLDFEFSIFVSLGYIKLVNKGLNNFVISLINSPYGVNWFNTNKVGDGTHAAKLNLGDLPKLLIPLPPLEEQVEIARIADLLLRHIDSLTNEIPACAGMTKPGGNDKAWWE